MSHHACAHAFFTLSLITLENENHHVWYNVSAKVMSSSLGHSLACAILLSMLGTACRGHFPVWWLTAVGERRLALACPSDKSCLTVCQHLLGLLAVGTLCYQLFGGSGMDISDVGFSLCTVPSYQKILSILCRAGSQSPRSGMACVIFWGQEWLVTDMLHRQWLHNIRKCQIHTWKQDLN